MWLMSYIAAVVDETGEVATLCGVYDGVVVNTEHVAATDALLLVALLPHVRNHLPIKIVTSLSLPSSVKKISHPAWL